MVLRTFTCFYIDDLDGGASSSSAQTSSPSKLTGLPTGIITALTKCYSPDCMEGMTCYSPRRPKKGDSILGPSINPLSRGGGSLVAADPGSSSSTISKVHDRGEEWINSVPSEVLVNFPENELTQLNSTYGSNGSNGIHPYTIGNGVDGEGYSNGNVQNGSGSEDREALFSPIIQRIGDIFLETATELFRVAHPTYIGGWPQAARRLREEYEPNSEWRMWVERVARQAQQLISNSNSSSTDSQSAASTAAYPSLSSPCGSSPASSSSVYREVRSLLSSTFLRDLVFAASEKSYLVAQQHPILYLNVDGFHAAPHAPPIIALCAISGHSL
ncbi:uncharacterized protein C8R40DRAFT_1075263 [Lentinula edodes]|uniref:uncharacterized protein n=1 Tax=Lentinula edodes TaxID=5353 RepID=UPI001E8E9B3B|nr:uncharacterized protein C8R40DRAFT_1075263 [Lentinula edodes]KAH7867907.1 hypothetical protein C8R40DRAFT_1075263 [Lentinula edodes]